MNQNSSNTRRLLANSISSLGLSDVANRTNSTVMDKIIDFIKNVNTWRKLLILTLTCIVLLGSYIAYRAIDRYDQLKRMNPWEYFEEQNIKDEKGLQALAEQAKTDIGCDAVLVFMYQPKGLKYYRKLQAISPALGFDDYVTSEQRLPMHHIAKTLDQFRNAGLSIITLSSGHYDSKFLIAMQYEVAYAIPIDVKGVDIGHLLFAFKTKQTEIPLTKMKRFTELSKLKIL